MIAWVGRTNSDASIIATEIEKSVETLFYLIEIGGRDGSRPRKSESICKSLLAFVANPRITDAIVQVAPQTAERLVLSYVKNPIDRRFAEPLLKLLVRSAINAEKTLAIEEAQHRSLGIRPSLTSGIFGNFAFLSSPVKPLEVIGNLHMRGVLFLTYSSAIREAVISSLVHSRAAEPKGPLHTALTTWGDRARTAIEYNLIALLADKEKMNDATELIGRGFVMVLSGIRENYQTSNFLVIQKNIEAVSIQLWGGIFRYFRFLDGIPLNELSMLTAIRPLQYIMRPGPTRFDPIIVNIFDARLKSELGKIKNGSTKDIWLLRMSLFMMLGDSIESDVAEPPFSTLLEWLMRNFHDLWIKEPALAKSALPPHAKYDPEERTMFIDLWNSNGDAMEFKTLPS
ncbi:hypothetical protein [Paraburkholderia metrosideri]|uniref:Uncharacterized protein n=1 Tax=Paraburkholderia metrosideri TaxID=580937 RepID=A0ABM8NQD0_9BURK|nr:hypothetical protein [Paraburkholderia metrosideri]CAD6538020.1 hypothetical protein LMG28140_03248 [Paraburkholderia metrosideri]